LSEPPLGMKECASHVANTAGHGSPGTNFMWRRPPCSAVAATRAVNDCPSQGCRRRLSYTCPICQCEKSPKANLRMEVEASRGSGDVVGNITILWKRGEHSSPQASNGARNSQRLLVRPRQLRKSSSNTKACKKKPGIGKRLPFKTKFGARFPHPLPIYGTENQGNQGKEATDNLT
jgi:hypothetical protein